jgi:hypothetical protein
VLYQPVGRPRDVRLRFTPGPPSHDAREVERHAQVRGLGLEEPACELPQAGCLRLGRVQDDLDTHAGTVTLSGEILMGYGYSGEPPF